MLRNVFSQTHSSAYSGGPCWPNNGIHGSCVPVVQVPRPTAAPLGGAEASALLSGLSEPRCKVVFAARERCQRAKATGLKELQPFYVYRTLEVAPAFTKNVWWRPFVITVLRNKNGKSSARPKCSEPRGAVCSFPLNWLSDTVRHERLRRGLEQVVWFRLTQSGRVRIGPPPLGSGLVGLSSEKKLAPPKVFPTSFSNLRPSAPPPTDGWTDGRTASG